jgi:hypothetical protein
MTSEGQAYVCGYFTTGMTLGSAILQAAGNADAWLGRYSIDGTLDWIVRAGGGGTVFDSANGVAVAASGDVFLAGQAGGSADFGHETLTVTGAGNVDLFVARRAATLPSITQSPTNLTVVLGSPAAFQVQVGGSGGLALYQWYKDGVALAGETNAALHIASTVLSSAGQYWVEVRNGEATVASDKAQLDLRFTLTLIAAGHGQVPSDPFATDYAAGATVQVLAVPDEDAFFAGWAGAVSGSDNPALVTMTNSQTVTAVFGSRRLSLDTQGRGSIAASPPGPLYNPGDTIQLTATPGDFYTFLAWSDGPTDNPRTLHLGVTNHYTAVFTNTVPVETITIGGVSRTAPVGMPQLLVNGGFVVSGPAAFGDNATIELRTSFPSGVLVWSLDGTTPTHSYEGPVTLKAPAVVRAAAFSADLSQVVEMPAIEVRVLPTFVLRAVTAGGGTLAVEPVRTRYFSNDVVTLTATPTNGWAFAGWNGDASGTNPVATVTLDRDRCVEAVFGTPLSVEVSGAGTVETLPSLGLYPYGTAVRFLGVPAAGSNFVAWSGALSGTVNPSVLTVTQPSPLVRGLFLAAGNDLPFVLRVNGGGSVLVFPRKNSYAAGESILLIASHDAAQQFVGYTGGLVETTNRLNLKITQPMIIDANFTDAPVLSMTNCVGPTNLANLRVLVGTRLGSVIRVERSTSRFAWSPWATLTNTLGRVLLSEPLGVDSSESFYRAIRLR